MTREVDAERTAWNNVVTSAASEIHAFTRTKTLQPPQGAEANMLSAVMCCLEQTGTLPDAISMLEQVHRRVLHEIDVGNFALQTHLPRRN